MEVVDANSACTLTRGPGVEVVKQGATLDDDGLGEVAIEVPIARLDVCGLGASEGQGRERGMGKRVYAGETRQGVDASTARCWTASGKF